MEVDVGLRYRADVPRALALIVSSCLGCISLDLFSDDVERAREDTHLPPPLIGPGGTTTGTDSMTPLLLNRDGHAGDGGGLANDTTVTCETHCDCPAAQDCINRICVRGTLSIYCCTQLGCPAGATCWFSDGVAGACPLHP